MELFEFYYDTINRNAIVVKPKEPFFNWQNQLFPDDEPIHEVDENNIYLIRQMDNNDVIKKWLKKNFDDIFKNELNEWIIDKDLWPSNRTYKMFTEWFEIEIVSMIMDMEEFPVTKD